MINTHTHTNDAIQIPICYASEALKAEPGENKKPSPRLVALSPMGAHGLLETPTRASRGELYEPTSTSRQSARSRWLRQQEPARALI